LKRLALAQAPLMVLKQAGSMVTAAFIGRISAIDVMLVALFLYGQ
jgi:hypothetical protein